MRMVVKVGVQAGTSRQGGSCYCIIGCYRNMRMRTSRVPKG